MDLLTRIRFYLLRWRVGQLHRSLRQLHRSLALLTTEWLRQAGI